MGNMNRKHPIDPREDDLIGDASLWSILLNRFWDTKKEVYYTFHALRCGGSKLELIGDKVKFTFGEDFEDSFVEKVKTKYLNQHQDFIQIVMNKMSRDLKNGFEKKLEECPF